MGVIELLKQMYAYALKEKLTYGLYHYSFEMHRGDKLQIAKVTITLIYSV